MLKNAIAIVFDSDSMLMPIDEMRHANHCMYGIR